MESSEASYGCDIWVKSLLARDVDRLLLYLRLHICVLLRQLGEDLVQYALGRAAEEDEMSFEDMSYGLRHRGC